MAVTFRSAGAVVSNGGNTVNVPFPASIAAGDLLVIQLFTAGGTSTLTTPTGWTLLLGPNTTPGTAAAHVYVLTKIATGSETGTQTVVFSGSFLGGIMSAFSGVDTTTPVDVSAYANLATSGTSAVAPSVTTTQANTLLLHMYWVGAASSSVTPNGADTEIYDSFDTNFGFVIEAATIAKAATGASGTSTATNSAAMNGGGAATLALAPTAVSVPVADFTGTPLSGNHPLSVAFSDTSTNSPTSWAWTFGDGGTSSTRNPTHTYTTAGNYTVALVATNTAGSDTKTRTGYVTVANASGTITKIKWGTGLAVTDEGGGVIRVDVVP